MTLPTSVVSTKKTTQVDEVPEDETTVSGIDIVDIAEEKSDVNIQEELNAALNHVQELELSVETSE
jgi:hypothetical protein